MTVSLSWLVSVNVGVNTTLLQTNFNQIALIGPMYFQSSPYQSPPSTWSGNPYQVYTSSAAFQTDFVPLRAAAIAASDTAQATRFQWLIDAVSSVFDQSPTPKNVTVMAMAPAGPLTNYTTELAALSAANNSWYGFSIVDNIPETSSPGNPSLSVINVTIIATGAVSIPVGSRLVGTSTTEPYLTYVPIEIGFAGTYTFTFYSFDYSTPVPINGMTSISYNNTTIPGIIVTNPLPSSPEAVNYSILYVSVVATASASIPAGTILIGATSLIPYLNISDGVVIPTGPSTLSFISLDVTTVIPINTMTSMVYNSSTIPNITYPITNPAVNDPQIVTIQPGILTPNIGIVAALSNFRSPSVNSPKKLFLDTNDPTVAGFVQNPENGGGSQDLMLCYHSMNFPTLTSPQNIATSLSAACLGAYFTNLFAFKVGLKPLSSMQLKGPTTNIDPTINTSNIGQVYNTGSTSNLVGWNNNVYAGFGSTSPIGLMQYGLMSSSTPSALLYLDQVVGADFIQLTAQNDLATFIIAQQPTGGILYDDSGIQQIVQVFKSSIQKAVVQNIIQPPINSDFVFSNYADVSLADVTNRIYQNLIFNGNFLSRIQQLAVQVNLTL